MPLLCTEDRTPFCTGWPCRLLLLREEMANLRQSALVKASSFPVHRVMTGSGEELRFLSPHYIILIYMIGSYSFARSLNDPKNSKPSSDVCLLERPQASVNSLLCSPSLKALLRIGPSPLPALFCYPASLQ